MKKHQLSSEAKISLKATAAVGSVMILMFVSFSYIVKWNLNNQKAKSLNLACNSIIEVIEDYLNPVNDGIYAFIDIPYYIDYSINDAVTGDNIYSNNPFIPLLPQTLGKSVHHIVKNYYMDGNLDILYMTVQTGNYIIQTSIDIENDSASKIIYSMPKTIPIVIIPIVIMTFLVIYFFMKRDFEQEHNFSANVSHELQTPVNAILGHAKMLDRWGKEDPEQTEKSLKIIINEARSMQSTIKNLLEITKLEKKMTSVNKETIDVNQFFEDLKNEFNYAENLEINYHTVFNSIHYDVKSDKELLHQIFIIAISNSLKFCPSPCKITLLCTVDKNKATFEISDNGNGFSKEILPYVFDRFYRGDAAHSRSKGGAGLGLSIAKSIATALDIKISAANGKTGGAVIKLEV